MTLSNIKQSIGQLELTLGDNLMLVIVLIIAVLLAILIFGGLLIDGLLTRKRARDKAKAAERLRKHLESLPSAKS